MMKITFVVGAGASADLNGAFPVGGALAQNIETQFSAELSAQDGPISTAIMRSTGFVPKHRQAMTQIRNSILSEDSIDDFLSAWAEIPYIDQVAKLAIAHFILDAEQRSALFIEGISDADRTTRLRQFNETWLGRIIRRPDKPRRDIEATLEAISFLVFNYDRQIEQYIKTYSRYVLNKLETEADTILNSILILHTYGSLGRISKPTPIPFGADSLYLNAAASNIRTYNEDHPSEDVEKIRKVVSEADRVVFLGCAFHQQNLDLLFGEPGTERKTDRVFYGTSRGVPHRKRVAVEKRLLALGSSFNLNPDQGCSVFLEGSENGIFYE